MVRIDAVLATMTRAAAVAALLSAIGGGAALAQGAPPGTSSWKVAQGAPPGSNSWKVAQGAYPGSSSWKTASADSATRALAMKDRGIPVASNPPAYYG